MKTICFNELKTENRKKKKEKKSFIPCLHVNISRVSNRVDDFATL